MKTWNVFIDDMNQKKIKSYNIFEHSRFNNEVNQLYNLYPSKDMFAHELRLILRCCFHTKCEYEVHISSMFNNESICKIDVYKQVMLNWNRFLDYVWDNRD